MDRIRVLHTGDFHLGYDYGKYEEHSEERAGENRETFGRIIDLCRNENVDVMLIAGDLFDNDNPKNELVEYVIRGFQSIEDVIIMIAPGNHDYYIKGSFYDRISTLCENVFIFDGEMDFYEFHIKGNTVRIYGAGFTKPIMPDSLMVQRKMFRDISINLGVFHGEIGLKGANSKYAPMSLKQIEENCFDYLALGHIHKQTEVLHAGRTNYAYCGCPEGLNFGTQGVKGVYIGEVAPGYADMEYVRTCKRIYIEEDIEVDEDESLRGNRNIADVIRSRLERKYGYGYRDNLYRINLFGKACQKTDRAELAEKLSDIYSVNICCEESDEWITGKEADRWQSDKKEHEGRTVSRERVKRIRNGRGRFVLNRINIISFGGLKNFRMDFTDGFQIIYGKNEFGKSTIMAFIKMMLYGSASKSRDVSQNLRKKYQPFDGSTMKGSMEFSIDDINYVVEREFGKSKSFDVCRVFETDSGRELSFPKEYEVGDYFLSIPQEDFNKTIFAGDSMGISETGVKSALLSRIANLSGGLEENADVSAELADVMKRMEMLQSKRGTSGKIPELDSRIDEYRKEIGRLNEEREYLVRSGGTDREGLKREKTVINGLIRKMERLEETSDENAKRKCLWLNRRKHLITMLIIVVALCVAAGAVLCKNRVIDIFLYTAGILSELFFFAKRLRIKRKIRNCGVYDEKLQERIDVIVEELGYNNYSIEDLEERIEKIEEMLSSDMGKGNEKLSRRIAECEERIRELRKKRSAYIVQYDELQEKSEQLKTLMEQAGKSITGPVNRRAAGLFSGMSGNEYESFMVDEDFNIRVKQCGSAVYEDWRHLSTATASQAYLSLRIALCETLGQGNMVLPLLFDDSLASYDEERVRKTVDILRQLDTQVILFTCHRL